MFHNLISVHLAGRGEDRGRERSLFVGQARDLVRMDMVGLEMMRMRVEVEIDEEGRREYF